MRAAVFHEPLFQSGVSQHCPAPRCPTTSTAEVDAELREAIEAALTGRGHWLVVVEGPSKVGKSRTLFEALRRCASHRDDTRYSWSLRCTADALRSLLEPGPPAIASRPEHAVLWLDDLEPFLNQGVTFQTLREWRSGRAGPNRRGDLRRQGQ